MCGGTRMRKQGMIVRWDDAKGFGFIRGAGAAQDVRITLDRFQEAMSGHVVANGDHVALEFRRREADAVRKRVGDHRDTPALDDPKTA